MALGIGLTITNTKAVLEALVGKESAFARTPKYSVSAKKIKSAPPSTASAWDGFPGWNSPIGTYFAATVYYAIDNENYITVPFLLLFVVGYWYTGLMSLLQGRFGGASRRATRTPSLSRWGFSEGSARRIGPTLVVTFLPSRALIPEINSNHFHVCGDFV